MAIIRNLFSQKNDPEGALLNHQGQVEIKAVSKRFRKHTLAKKSYSTVKTTLLSRLFNSRYPRDNFIQALDSVTIEIKPGSSLGVIGRNGSGKSTLLKLIAGIYRPDAGEVIVNGRISALIELGAGFHPDFTGRENVYLGGVMYGLTKDQIDQRFQSIVSFAELEDFIDDPVRTYSSGMYMRLGFSLAVHTDPDILLIDEVLAVGDAKFIHRCKDIISEFKRRGKTLIFVTHDLEAVRRWCDEAIWLESGVVKKRGEPGLVVDSYLEAVEHSEESQLAIDNKTSEVVAKFGQAGERWGNKAVEITNVRMLDAHGEVRWLYHSDDPVIVEVHYRFNQPVADLVFGVGIIRADGLNVHGCNTEIDKIAVPLQEENTEGFYRYCIDRLALTDGSYYLDVAAHQLDGFPFDYHHMIYKFVVRSLHNVQGVINPSHHWTFPADYSGISYQRMSKVK